MSNVSDILQYFSTWNNLQFFLKKKKKCTKTMKEQYFPTLQPCGLKIKFLLMAIKDETDQEHVMQKAS